MQTVRQLLSEKYTITPGDETKTQSWVSLSDKRTILAAIGDDGIFTLITRVTYARLAEFIRSQSITAYDPQSHKRLLEFICDGTDPRVARNPIDRNEPGAAQSLQHPPTPTPCITSGASESRKGRIRLAAVKAKRKVKSD